jgi:long-chain fatty acid transport protein
MKKIFLGYFFGSCLGYSFGLMPIESASAAGFALGEQSVKAVGNSLAGAAATAEDASTIFYNPAGLTELSGFQLQAGGHFIIPNVRFENASGGGNQGGDAGVSAVVPNLYAAWDVGDRFKLGIGVNVPFGLATDYDSNWIGRYQGLKSKLATMNINPTVAAKITDQWSIGAGVNLQYAKAELSNAIDFGLIAGLGNGSSDGSVKIDGSDWRWGFNLGALYKPTPNSKIGLAYRSAITHNLQGRADFTVPSNLAVLTRQGTFTDTDVTAQLKTPDTLSLSAVQKISPQVTLLGDVTWTGWSRFKELRVNFANPAQPAIVQPENWHDTFRLALGLNYAASKALLLRAGVARDPTPVPNAFRTVRIPDADRTWLSLGATYQPTPKFNLDLGYAHQFIGDAPLNQASPTGGTLIGEFKGAINIISAQLRWAF